MKLRMTSCLTCTDTLQLTYVTGFAKRDHFCQNICDLICQKSTVQISQENSYVYIQFLYMHNYSIIIYTKMFLVFFNIVFLSQIRSQMF